MTEAIAWPRKTRELQTRLFDSSIWNEFVFRDGDIVIATYPKAGTTWMQQIVGQLLFGGDPDLEVSRLSPWVDFRVVPKVETMAMLDAQTHRRFVKTHLPLDALVFSPNARYIYVARDGRDVAWSYYNHHASFTQSWRDHLNHLARIAALPLEPPPTDIRQFWREWLDRDGYPGPSFWNHIRGWWAIRELPNVILVHYANLKRDLPAEIRRVAAYLDVPIDEARWDTILELCSFDWMKANAAKVVPRGGTQFEGGAQTFI
jgi:aryl sulfotransferase